MLLPIQNQFFKTCFPISTPDLRFDKRDWCIRYEDDNQNKANVEVPSPVAGMIIEIFFKGGDEIKTGDPIAICESD
jgi:biotin carboxyl carrier protein